MHNVENESETWRYRECAEEFARNLGADDRITAYRMVDSLTGDCEETYTWRRQCDGLTPIYKSGDCAIAIRCGLLEQFGEGTFKRSEIR
jgi:hypothetical protein